MGSDGCKRIKYVLRKAKNRMGSVLWMFGMSIKPGINWLVSEELELKETL